MQSYSEQTIVLTHTFAIDRGLGGWEFYAEHNVLYTEKSMNNILVASGKFTVYKKGGRDDTWLLNLSDKSAPHQRPCTDSINYNGDEYSRAFVESFEVLSADTCA